jgi:hypothetical protein
MKLGTPIAAAAARPTRAFFERLNRFLIGFDLIYFDGES